MPELTPNFSIPIPSDPLSQLDARRAWVAIDAALAGLPIFQSSAYASLNAAVAAIGATPGVLSISAANFPSGNSTTVPPTLVIDWGSVGSLLFTTGQSVTFQSDNSQWPLRKIFNNALAGQGEVLWTGNRTTVYGLFQWWGAKGDDSTDCSAAIQAGIDSLDASDISGTFVVPDGIYRIAGALQDTSFSNSQIVLPKRSISQSMITVRIMGVSPAAQAWPTEAGAIFKSTLASGNGSIISVKCNWGSSTATVFLDSQNRHSRIEIQIVNMIVRAIANPTISGLDLRFCHRSVIKDSRIDVAGITAGPDSIVPDLFCTEPTSATSYGLLTMMDSIGSAAIVNNVTIEGWYNGWAWGELVNADNITVGACKVGIEFRGATHGSVAGRLLFVSTAKNLISTGRDAYFTNLSGPNTNNVNIQELGLENSSSLMTWAATTVHIDDSNNYLHGYAGWYQGLIGAQSILKTGGANLHTREIARSYNTRAPFTEVADGTDQYQASDHAFDETYRGLPSDGGSRIAWKVMTTDQAGIANLVGILAFMNANIAAPNDKRLAQIAGFTDGAINSGALEFYTMNAGTLARRAWFDKIGNFNLTGLMPRGEGSTIASASSIAPVSSVHVVSGTAAIDTITVPDILAGAAVQITLAPSGAWTWTTAGNIAAAGTAVPGRAVLATWIPSISKWNLAAYPAGGGDALIANPLSQFAATTSAQLRSVLSDENGTGAALFDSATSPTFLVGLTVPSVFLAEGGVINWDNGDVTLTQSGNTLSVMGGNVAIGTATPNRDLVVAGGGQAVLQVTDTNLGVSAANGFQIQQVGADTNLLNYENGYLAFFTNVTEQMRITAVGNVGIGTAAFGTSAAKVLGLRNGTAPSTGPSDTVQFYSSDDAAGHTIPSFFCEGTNVVATGQADSASSVRVKMRINGVVRTFLCI